MANKFKRQMFHRYRQRHLPRRQCVYCGGGEPDELTKDHAHPRRDGGSGGSNLLPACKACNGAKGGMPLRSWLRKFSHGDLLLIQLRIQELPRIIRGEQDPVLAAVAAVLAEKETDMAKVSTNWAVLNKMCGRE